MQPIILSRSRPRFLLAPWMHDRNVCMRHTQVQRSRSRKRVPVVSAARVFGLASVAALLLGACASAPPPPAEVPGRLSPSDEAYALQAAQNHPIAQTYDQPRPADTLPMAPPTVPEGALPPPAAPEAQPAQPAPPPPRDQVIIVGNEPAPPSTTYIWPQTYVDTPYAWVDGAWVVRPGAYGYVTTPWVGVGVGVGFGVGYGWGWGYGYPYGYGYAYPHHHHPPPVYVPPPVHVHPPVIYPRARAPVAVAPARPVASPHGRYPDAAPRSSWGASSPRRTVDVTPRAPAMRSFSATPRLGAPTRLPSRPVSRPVSIAPSRPASIAPSRPVSIAPSRAASAAPSRGIHFAPSSARRATVRMR